MNPRINDGTRPSHLDLGRDRVGEKALSEEARALESSRSWDARVEKGQPLPLDVQSLRAFAATMHDEPANTAVGFEHALPSGPSPPGLNRGLDRKLARPGGFRRWVGLSAVAMAAAAALVFAFRPPALDSPNRIKGEAELDFVVLRDGQPVPGSPDQPVHPGDMIQFTYRGSSDQLVLVGVDGSGAVIAYYPDEGDVPVSVIPGERHLLEGSILLDDAPGPEVFVAYFGEARVSEVKTLVSDEFIAGGVAAVRALDVARPDIAILVLDKE